ncbi:response regulator transcription factor [Kitasatospora sp. GP82]|uniref:response regulator transcription factor n=1 Tax=Kitasatospora sp. GP82 TaxID=3035089 RepID=UPI00247428CC|nr:response regulator transcription factor [Kitasatospora sp. GP82]MDH6130561.1 DNA-binding response OmpR family regulator [Kitasatospora sp. GP82]
MARVLLVEDDDGLREALDLALSGLGHEVLGAPDGPSGLEKLTAGRQVDCVVLDVMMPHMDGFEVCRGIRRLGQTPVIMLTARSEPIDIVAGLECGADDYVAKPVEPRVLDARIKAVLRRVAPIAEPNSGAGIVDMGSVRVDTRAMSVTKHGVPLELTPTELRLLLEFVLHPGQVLTRQVLLDRVWDYGYLGDSRIVDACVWRLRAKTEDDPARPSLIATVRGVGYRLDLP